MTIGEKIKIQRKKAGLTQKKLGELSETSETTIKQYEAGKRQPRLEQLVKIAISLRVSLLSLIDENEYHSMIEVIPSEAMDSAIRNHNANNVTSDENALTADYMKLNKLGKEEARKRVNELTEIPRYTKPDEPPQE